MLAAPPAGAVPPGDPWRTAREDDGVTVYVRDVPDSAYDESLARTTVEAPLETLVALVMDGASHHLWVDTVVESRVLESVADNDVFIYSRSDAPWPVLDRDAVVRSRASQDPDSLVVTVETEGAPDRLPERDGLVRVPSIDVRWTFSPLEDGTVAVTYRAHNDPGGAIPTWLVNSMLSEQPHRTLLNLRRLLTRANDYEDADLPYVAAPGD